ncbi:Hypothetical predicted protein [Pelobates cultripes]|uniref:Uncharacterized protein n=1 Tax=Pelobates cultripes TaxID=61616 RepID=A0AAD1VSC4_PELCU|nr:Hypothetical predicted protein [Pelobates cultripes]
MACVTPDVDPKIAQFLGKSGWKFKRGFDYSLRHCQDKVLDVLGPVAKIFNMVESALIEGAPIDLLAIRGWIQRSICLIGKAILMKIEPKLLNLAISEPGTQAKGLLFGDDFVKVLGKYVSTFMALDKAQTNMKHVFSQKVFDGTSRHRGHLSGRSSWSLYSGYQGSATSRFQPL